MGSGTSPFSERWSMTGHHYNPFNFSEKIFTKEVWYVMPVMSHSLLHMR